MSGHARPPETGYNLRPAGRKLIVLLMLKLSKRQIRGAAMQQIADWLEKLGLGQYAQRFAENDIRFLILSDLTDQDLKRSAFRRSVIGVSCCAR